MTDDQLSQLSQEGLWLFCALDIAAKHAGENPFRFSQRNAWNAFVGVSDSMTPENNGAAMKEALKECVDQGLIVPCKGPGFVMIDGVIYLCLSYDFSPLGAGSAASARKMLSEQKRNDCVRFEEYLNKKKEEGINLFDKF